MSNNKLYRIKSDYSITKKHLLTTVGDIYESDYLTISPMGDLFADQTQVFSGTNFKFTIRNNINQQRRHSRGSWVEYNGDSRLSIENKIKLKPDYSSIKDFAYYGSASELIKSTVNSVILNFPAELYFSSNDLELNGKQYYIIENDFEIDIYSQSMPINTIKSELK